MPDGPIIRDTREDIRDREDRSNNYMLMGLLFAAAIALLFLFGPRMFNASDNKVDVNATQPGIDSPTTSETKKQP